MSLCCIPTFRTELTLSTYWTGELTPFCQVMHTLKGQNGNNYFLMITLRRVITLIIANNCVF